jgi:hypothetical protein
MPTRRPAETTPDLFSAKATAKAPESQAVPQGKAEPDNLASQPHYLLPKDLAGALKGLNDTEVDILLAAVTTEAARRGRLPAGAAAETPPTDTKRQRSQALAEDGAGSLTTGKLNAVRAAFKAGVKPSAIARQFGISQSDVRKALATEGRDRKSWR